MKYIIAILAWLAIVIPGMWLIMGLDITGRDADLAQFGLGFLLGASSVKIILIFMPDFWDDLL